LKPVFIIAIIAVAMIWMMVPSSFAEISITDDSTGGDCTTIGTWNSASKTCTLTSDISDNIVINSDGITLNGNDHEIVVLPIYLGQGLPGFSEVTAISSIGKKNLTVENFIIKTWSMGIQFDDVSDTLIQNNHLIGTSPINWPHGNYGLYGIYSDGIDGTNNLIKNNLLENVAKVSIAVKNGIVDGNTITSHFPSEGVAILTYGNSEVQNNITDNKFEVYGKNNKIHDNTLTWWSTVPSGENKAISWHNNLLESNKIPNSSEGSILFGGKYADRVPDGGNYYSETVGCLDENYDNICDFQYNWKDDAWTFPDAWKTSIITEGDVTSEAISLSENPVSYSVIAEKSGQSVSISCNYASGSMFPLGTTQVICQTDEGRITAFDIIVLDTISPTLTIPDDISVMTSVPQGLSVDFDVSATDAVGLENHVSCNASSGELFPIGDTLVTCTATDTSGNVSSEIFALTVESDTPPPTINVPNNIVVFAGTSSGINSNYSQVTATDPLGVSSGPTCDYVSGSFFNLGTTTITCTATNTPGFSSTATFTITVNPPQSITLELLPSRDDIGTEWKFPTNRQVYNELNDRGYTPDDYVGFAESTWYGYMKGGGYDSNFLDLYIYRFDTKNNANMFYSDHVTYWSDRGGYSEWNPGWNSVSAEDCYGRSTSAMYTDKISLYCIQDSIVIFVTTTGNEYLMQDELSNFADGVFDNMSKVNITPSKTESNPMCGEGTVFENGQCVIGTSEGGGCLIATATYGSELAPQVQQLRELRDNQLLQTESGTAFMGTFNDIYYSFSPIIADYERENPYFKEAVKLAITPMISSLSFMENAESESEVLSIGISVIALNLGMYLGVPAIVVVGIKKRSSQ
jgi:hypothetical protein